MNKEGIISCCGLYCNNCKAFISGKCLGCHMNTKAEKWCAVKKCCKEKGIENCSKCSEYSDYKKCKKFNNLISKIFGLIFGSDRNACINCIKEKGETAYIEIMKKNKSHNNPNKN